MVADYQLLEELGRGGMGVVYRARQRGVEREVALKMMLGGAMESATGIQRFINEPRIQAVFQHPNIVAVHEVGEWEGQPFFSMDLIDGETLAQRRAKGDIPVKKAAHYVEKVAEAIHYAHERGFLHRDLKCSNVLLGADDQPRVTDFGLARSLADSSSVTLDGQILGSPETMAPEQVVPGRASQIGVRTDVYGLGAMLYQLLTGQPVFRADNRETVFAKILHADPLPPRALNPAVPRDLETICLKCLEKDPINRYESANVLAAELRRFQNGDPIMARPLNPVAKAARWCLKHPIQALLALVIGMSGVLLASSRLQLVGAEREVRVREFLLDCQYARLTVQTAGWSSRVLLAASNVLRFGQLPVVRDHSAASLIGFDAALKQELKGFEQLQLSAGPGGSNVLLVCNEAGTSPSIDGSANTFKVWNASSGRLVSFATRGAGPVGWLSNSIPLQLLPSATNKLRYSLWNLADSNLLRSFDVPEPSDIAESRAKSKERPTWGLSPDGQVVAVAHPFSRSNGVLVVWDSHSGRQLAKLDLPYAGAVNTMTIWNEANLVALGDDNGGVTICRFGAISSVRRVQEGTAQIQSLAFAREPRSSDPATNSTNLLIAAGDSGGAVVVWDAASLKSRCRLVGHSSELVAMNNDGLLAMGGQEFLELWDSYTSKLLLRVPLDDEQTGLMFSADGRELVAASVGSESLGRLSVWRLENGRGIQTLRGLDSQISQVSFSSDGSRLAAFSKNHEASVHDVKSGRLLRVVSMPHETMSKEGSLSLGRGGHELACASERTVRRWNVDTGQLLNEVRLRPGLDNVLRFGRSEELLLFRMEAQNKRVVPYSVADPAVFPRVCRLYNVLSDTPQQPFLEITNFNYGTRSIQGSGDGRFFIIDGIECHEGVTNHVLACYHAPERRLLWSRRMPAADWLLSPPLLDAEGSVVVLEERATGTVSTIDLLAGTLLTHGNIGRIAAVGPKALTWVSWGDRVSRGLQLHSHNRTVPQVVLGLDGSPEVGWPAFSPGGQFLSWGQADRTILLFELGRIQQILESIGTQW